MSNGIAKVPLKNSDQVNHSHYVVSCEAFDRIWINFTILCIEFCPLRPLHQIIVWSAQTSLLCLPVYLHLVLCDSAPIKTSQRRRMLQLNLRITSSTGEFAQVSGVNQCNPSQRENRRCMVRTSLDERTDKLHYQLNEACGRMWGHCFEHSKRRWWQLLVHYIVGLK